MTGINKQGHIKPNPKQHIILTEPEKLGIKLGRITQVRMIVPGNTYPKTGFNHPALRVNSVVHIDDSLSIKIVAIRIERIQHITIADALASGYPKRPSARFNHSDQLSLDPHTVTYFDEAWDDKHGAGAYNSNDWVYVFHVKQWGEV